MDIRKITSGEKWKRESRRIMNLTAIDLRCIILMKVGFHTDEALSEIVRRKTSEEEECGKVFWGYGGTLCHPLTQIKPFVQRAQEQNLKPMLVMAFTPSRFAITDSEWAREMSVDKKVWKPIPPGVYVKGSRYAIVCKGFRKANEEIDLAAYKVAVGKRRGMRLSDYIRHRIDKACAFRARKTHPEQGTTVAISYVAEIVRPYAVFVR